RTDTGSLLWRERGYEAIIPFAVNDPATICKPGAFNIGAWIIGNTAWVIVGMITDDPYLWGLFGFYLITAFIGLRVALRAI
ncbi:MAG: hypothetical protein D5R96_00065, partial [Methanocalculus sp. MSAO_Arc2]|uniref:hypothetical protein n=1 Tax=Methanocalculus sp. MSAO_Arc2 TaxID=2293855 RepID=UPI000FF83BA8